MDTDKKDNEILQTSSSEDSKMSLFNKGILTNRYVFLEKRTQKIATAIHMISDVIAPNESIRAFLRETSLSLLSLSFGFEISTGEYLEHAINQYDSSLRKLTALVELSESLHLVSVMNAGILLKEFSNIGTYIGDFKRDLKAPSKNLSGVPSAIGEVSFGEMFSTFDMERPSIRQNVLDKGHIPNQVVQKGQVQTKKFRNSKQLEIVLKSERRNSILNVIKDKSEITVKDAASVIKNYSEKTIQRELIAMVNEGILKKSGNKRWSKYSIKTK